MPRTKLSPARRAALSVLDEARRRDGYVRELLDGSVEIRKLDPRDAALARRLALTATATQGCLDELLDRVLTRPNKVAPRVRCALRIAAVELVYLGTPVEVAVSQGVELVRSCAPAAAGMANAVLRKVAGAAEGYLAGEDVEPAERPLTAAARRAGLPVWLAREIQVSLGEERAQGLFDAELGPAPLAAHQNPLREDSLRGESPAALAAHDAESGNALQLPGLLASVDVRAAGTRAALKHADAAISDAHAQLIATAATRPGSCLEIGAGRGTKTFVMLSQATRAGFAREHVALDLYEVKCQQNLERLHRAGLDAANVRTLAGDACDLDTALAPLDAATASRRLFDTVLVDAPCSGTGTMRRHPEIPWRLVPQDIERDLPQLQLALLKQAAQRVAPHSELFYATCSVLKQENARVVDAFLASPEGAAFQLAPVSDAAIFEFPAFAPAATVLRANESLCGLFQTAPAPHAFDGHFCARFIRTR